MKKKKYIRAVFWLIVSLVFLSGCVRPRIEHQNVNGLKYYTDYNNFRHQTGHPFEISDSLKISGKEKLAGVPVGSLLEYGDYLLFNTANGYLYAGLKSDMSSLANIRLGKGCVASPTLYEGIAYIPFLKGKNGLVAYDFKHAGTIWKLAGELSASSPVIASGLLIHCAANGRLTAYDLKNHKIQWSVESGEPIKASMAASDSLIYMCSRDGLVQAYRISDGTLQWSTRTDDHFYAPPLLHGNMLYAFSFGGSIYMFNAHDGREIKQNQMNAPIYFGATNDKKHIYVVADNGQIAAIALNNLHTDWISRINGPPSTAPVSIRNELIISSASRKLYRINSQSGDILQTIKLKRRATIQPLFSGKRIFSGTREASLIALKDVGKK